MSNIEYQGPEHQYKPELGAAGDGTIVSLIPDQNSYASMDYLKQNLTSLELQTKILIDQIENSLQSFSLSISEDDTNLAAAHKAEWPSSSLGAPSNYITYRYYKTVGLHDSSASAYIRQRYEEAARDVNGSNAIDVLPLVQTISNETSLIKEYLDTHVGDLSDSSERRSVELLQDWTESALKNTGDLRNLFQKSDTQRALPESDVEQVTSAEAVRSQALFKVNLNRLNADLEKNLEVLKKTFQAHADTFYKSYLGPSLGFRKSVSQNVYPVLPGQLGREVNASVNSLDRQMGNMLADQARRNMIFDQKIQDIKTTIDQRDTYRSYIIQLSSKGNTPASTFLPVTDSAEEASYFDSTIEQAPTSVESATPQFEAPHNLLAGIEDATAHPQYVLKAGDSLSGDLLLEDGVKVDGMVPHIHRHTGTDGTEKIHGSDIAPDSVDSTSVNPDDKPVTPTNLQLISISSTQGNTGHLTFSALISWDGTSTNTFEVQVAKVA